MSLDHAVDEDLRTMYEDMIAEALWPTQVSSAIDVFATARYEADSRLKGTLDLSDYTSQSEYPLVAWRCTGTTRLGEFTAQTAWWNLSGVIKFAACGPEDIDETSVSRALLTDVAKAEGILRAQLYDSRLIDGPFGIADASLIGGKGTGKTYCVKEVTIGEPEVSIAPQGGGDEGTDEWGADDRLGFNVWIGELPVDIEIIVI